MDVSKTIIYRQIGAKVAYYRTLRGMTQEQLAEKINGVYEFRDLLGEEIKKLIK